MKNWSAAFDELRRRSTSQLRESVGVASPFSFSPTHDTSDVPDYISSLWGDLDGEHSSVIALPGRDMNLVRDMLITAAKFYHVIDCVRSHIARGAMTWAIVDAYHASLVGTRLISALYGVLSYSIEGRTVLIDFRPEFGTVDDQKTFKKKYKNLDDPIRIIRPVTKQLSQSDAWSLVIRLCNLTKCPPDDQQSVDDIKDTASRKVSAFRNGILYDSVAWSWLDDFGVDPSSLEVRHQRLSTSGANHSVTVEALVEIFKFANSRLIALCQAVGVDPAEVSNLTSKGHGPVQLLG